MVLLGGMMITMGVLRLIPENTIPNISFYSIEISANTLALGLGAGLLVVGSLVLGFMKDRYAIRIATAEGEKNVLVSPRREYVAEVVDALNKAFMTLVSPKRGKGW